MLQEEVEDAPAKVYGISELRNAGKSASADSVCPDAEDIATIIFTSGTTGKSKGVMLTQNNLASNVEAVKITAEPGTAVLSVLPIHHAFCLVMDWLKGFSLGATLCINDSLLHMVRNMSIFKPDIMLMVPMMIETIYKRLAAADPSIPKAVLAEKVFGGKLRIIFTGGAHLDPYYIDRFAEYGVEVLEGYGMSECSPVISNNTPENHKKGSIGKPLENVEIRFENGEILVKGSSVMKGYYQMPDETAETLKDGGQRVPRRQSAGEDLGFDLPADLIVDRLAAVVSDNEFHGSPPFVLYIHSIYSWREMSRGIFKIFRGRFRGSVVY